MALRVVGDPEIRRAVARRLAAGHRVLEEALDPREAGDDLVLVERSGLWWDRPRLG